MNCKKNSTKLKHKIITFKNEIKCMKNIQIFDSMNMNKTILHLPFTGLDDTLGFNLLILDFMITHSF